MVRLGLARRSRSSPILFLINIGTPYSREGKGDLWMIFRIITRNKACRSIYGNVPMTTLIILGEAKQRRNRAHYLRKQRPSTNWERGEKGENMRRKRRSGGFWYVLIPHEQFGLLPHAQCLQNSLPFRFGFLRSRRGKDGGERSPYNILILSGIYWSPYPCPVNTFCQGEGKLPRRL